VGALYTDADFYRALSNSLSPNGLLVSQVGQSSASDDPPEEHSIDRHLDGFTRGLSEQRFESIREYSEVRTGEKGILCCIVIMTARLTDFAPCNRMAVASIGRGLS
jgi:spermidine synthase